MRRIFIILGLLSAVIAVILAAMATTPMVYLPAILALVFGAASFYQSKQKSKKVVQLIFLLTILALSLATYKSIFNTIEKETSEQTEEIIQSTEKDSGTNASE